MVGAHQAIFDRDLTGNKVDQAAVDEVRADPSGSFFVQDEAFAFDTRQAA
jgi:hypothetical protein